MYYVIGFAVIATFALYYYRDRIGPLWTFLGLALTFTITGIKIASTRKPEGKPGDTKPYRDPIVEGHKKVVEKADKKLKKIRKQKEQIDETVYRYPDDRPDPDLVRDLEDILRRVHE